MTSRRDTMRSSLRALVAVPFAAALGLSGACSSAGSHATSTAGSGDAGAACVSDREFFIRNVWTPTLGSKCIQCHMPDGIAVEQDHARFVLQPPSYPGFLDANLAMVQKTAALQSDGVSLLLLKPFGKLGHGGGVQIDDGSPEAVALQAMLTRFG